MEVGHFRQTFCLSDNKNLYLKQWLVDFQNTIYNITENNSDRLNWMTRFRMTINPNPDHWTALRGFTWPCTSNKFSPLFTASCQNWVSAVPHILSGGGRNKAAVSEFGTNSSLSVLIIYTDHICFWSCDLAGDVFFFLPNPVLSSSFRKVKLHWWYLPQEEHCVTLLVLTPVHHPWLNTGRTFTLQDYTI